MATLANVGKVGVVDSGFGLCSCVVDVSGPLSLLALLALLALLQLSVLSALLFLFHVVVLLVLVLGGERVSVGGYCGAHEAIIVVAAGVVAVAAGAAGVPG